MEILIGLGIMIVAQVCKRWISPKYGDNGVHLFIFGLALFVTAIQMIAVNNPHVMTLLKQAGLMLVATVGLYHVIFEKLGGVMSKNVLSLD